MASGIERAANDNLIYEALLNAGLSNEDLLLAGALKVRAYCIFIGAGYSASIAMVPVSLYFVSRSVVSGGTSGIGSGGITALIVFLGSAVSFGALWGDRLARQALNLVLPKQD